MEIKDIKEVFGMVSFKNPNVANELVVSLEFVLDVLDNFESSNNQELVCDYCGHHDNNVDAFVLKCSGCVTKSNKDIVKTFNHHVIDKIRNSHTDSEVRRYLGNILK